MKETKESKLTRILEQAILGQKGNSVRRIVNIVAKAYNTDKGGLTKYFDHQNQLIAGIATSAHYQLVGNEEVLSEGKYSGLGATLIKSSEDLEFGQNQLNFARLSGNALRRSTNSEGALSRSTNSGSALGNSINSGNALGNSINSEGALWNSTNFGSALWDSINSGSVLWDSINSGSALSGSINSGNALIYSTNSGGSLRRSTNSGSALSGSINSGSSLKNSKMPLKTRIKLKKFF